MGPRARSAESIPRVARGLEHARREYVVESMWSRARAAASSWVTMRREYVVESTRGGLVVGDDEAGARAGPHVARLDLDRLHVPHPLLQQPPAGQQPCQGVPPAGIYLRYRCAVASLRILVAEAIHAK